MLSVLQAVLYNAFPTCRFFNYLEQQVKGAEAGVFVGGRTAETKGAKMRAKRVTGDGHCNLAPA